MNLRSAWSFKQPGAEATSCAGLRRVGEAATDVTKRELAELQLRAIERFGPRTGELSAADRALVERLRAAALQGAGRRREALSAWQ